MEIVIGKAFESKVLKEDREKYKNADVAISASGTITELTKDNSYEGTRYSIKLELRST